MLLALGPALFRRLGQQWGAIDQMVGGRQTGQKEEHDLVFGG